jgi:hypothetical membrane protein
MILLSFLFPRIRRVSESVQDTLELPAAIRVGPTMQRRRPLLLAGLLVPILYFGTILASATLVPGYSHVSQYASELGMAEAASARLFNGGILLAGLAAIFGSVGIYLAVESEGGRRVWSALAALALGLFGVGLLFGALFPMPDPRHGGFGLGMGVHLAPLFLALALRPVEGRGRLVRYLLATAVLMLVMLLPMMGVGGLVTRANVGLFQRLYALLVFVWIGVASLALLTPETSGAGRSARPAS